MTDLNDRTRLIDCLAYFLSLRVLQISKNRKIANVHDLIQLWFKFVLKNQRKHLANSKIGIWHSCKPSLLRKYRHIKILEKKNKIKFIKNLNKIGYCFSTKKKSFLVKIMKAFQRHYRQELINGHTDKECLIIAQNLLKKL